MTSAASVLADAFDRIQGSVHRVLDGLTPEQLTARVDSGANTIAWLVWHLTRVQDDHLADAAGSPQLWVTGGWFDRFALPFDVDATGYGQTSDDVALVEGLTPELLAGYFDEVHAQTIVYVSALGDDDLDRIVDTRWTPAVTLAARLVSVIGDDTQHVGQAAFIKGVLKRR
ncbi:mycothiol transferase [Subtercola frigoramans]|uniref:Damage-inducible protein DinB n=1 Tax=Subtercola frigoramans TaxID=120298 RepID=A0ABS2L6U0_9MICO|nr:DinB family protein [Subtercola frigoramans]MBM7472445.1 putative damage-inducible protein DinB [Subtercola frigoramans]